MKTVLTALAITATLLVSFSSPANCVAQIDSAGNDGPMPQTREHILLARQVGVPLASLYLLGTPNAGPVPSLAAAIAGAAIRGSWWSHPRSHEIFELTRVIRDRNDVLVCRLVNGKVTFVHRRLWPALVRVAKHFPKKQLAQVHEVHTAPGHHVTKEVAFPRWVPTEVSAEASQLSEEEAVRKLGDWFS